jgi:hypothetical protein
MCVVRSSISRILIFNEQNKTMLKLSYMLCVILQGG